MLQIDVIVNVKFTEYREKQKICPRVLSNIRFWKVKPVNNRKTFVTLSDGEFVLHLEAKETVKYVNSLGFNFTLTTNGLATNKILELVNESKCKNFQISFDGLPKTYQEIRGINEL